MHPLDHVGVAVTDLDAAIAFYKSTFGVAAVDREVLDAQGVEVAFVPLGNCTIELLASLTDAGPLGKFLIDRGPGLHHLCYRVPDIRAELARLKAAGVRLIDEQPRNGARGHLVAFLHPKSIGGVLTELCQLSHTAKIS